ncbi:MAG: hypothetical protein CVV18_08370 [Gammaproteobacteria bacterium HGW-Gammaproteobacteria-8]|nr:MAG: hypothetical protein CVV18_08370 [Gammaproteobacteria bacterium HGW-Gammaproteobacteria-8]
MMKSVKVSKSVRTPSIRSEKIGRNQPCLCDSGKKYKKPPAAH